MKKSEEVTIAPLSFDPTEPQEWSGAGLQHLQLGVGRVGQVLANLAPQVSSIATWQLRVREGSWQ